MSVFDLDQYYTLNEATNRLNISARWLKRLAKSRPIRTAHHKFLKGRILFKKEDIHSLESEMAPYNQLTTINELADRLNVDYVYLRNLILRQQLEFIKAPRNLFEANQRVFLDDVAVEKIVSTFTNKTAAEIRFRKDNYFHPDFGIYLYQQMFDAEGNLYRIIKKRERGLRVWGVLSDTSEFIPLELAIDTLALKPVFTNLYFAEVKSIRTTSTFELTSPAKEKELFTFIDSLHEKIGPNNVRVEIKANKVFVQSLYTPSAELNPTEQMTKLKINLPTEHYNKLLAAAQVAGSSLDQLVQEIVSVHLFESNH